MKKAFMLGPVGHFGLAVRDPKRSADWLKNALQLDDYGSDGESVGIGNDAVTIWFHEGVPHPKTIAHIAFAVPDRDALQRALMHLKKIGAEVEDSGDEIGEQAPGSPYIGLWFRDPDGYRWELSAHE